jgi:hypothetical protein
LLFADEDGELRHSAELSGNNFEEDVVVDDEGEFAAFELDFFDFIPCFDAIEAET